MDKCAKIQTYHVKLFADYLERLRSTPDGDESLLEVDGQAILRFCLCMFSQVV